MEEHQPPRLKHTPFALGSPSQTTCNSKPSWVKGMLEVRTELAWGRRKGLKRETTEEPEDNLVSVMAAAMIDLL